MAPLARRLVESRPFQGVVVAVILLAGVLAGLETSPALMARHGSLLNGLDQAVLALFVAEFALRLAAHGRRPLDYFRNGWNLFDAAIIVLCLLPVGGPFAAVLRLARVLRLLRLVTTLPTLQLLVGALLKSLSAMGYVGLLLALLFYIYAVAGVHWFGAASPEHFGSLPVALLTLFRIVTLDNWGDIFDRALEAAPDLKVVLFFVSFIVFGTMIILNLFIGIIMNSMAQMHDEIAARRASAAPAGPAPDSELRALEAELGRLQHRLRAFRERAGTDA